MQLDVYVEPDKRDWIVVGVAEASVAQQSLSGNEERLYCAHGGEPGLNGNYAAGILEGLLHFQPGWREHLEVGP